ncbi:MAG TPA: hypothetical protein VMV50_00800 [Candidatus Paceibacterota bacterium]|nr:hypothetical protein [Candidatus Paceibacterota bacterium]
MASPKTTEVVVVIAPRIGGEEMFFRVTIREQQLKDSLKNSWYVQRLFTEFKDTACAMYGLDAEAYVVGIADEKPTVGMYTWDLSEGESLLH